MANIDRLIVAEIGNNHNGDFGLARELIFAAQAVGASAVKFQKKDIETAFSRDRLNSLYRHRNSFGNTYREHKEHLEFKSHEIAALFHQARDIGIKPFATPFDLRSVEVLEDIGNPIYKISSFHVTHLGLIKSVCETGKPIILSTGMATASEVNKAVALIKSNGNNLTLLHCVCAYPAPAKELNLNMIGELQKFNVPVGYSSHEIGIDFCLVALALGARIIERHFTLDKRMQGPDHMLSSDPEEMAKLVRMSKQIPGAMGHKTKCILDCEKENRKKYKWTMRTKEPASGDICETQTATFGRMLSC